MKMEFKITMQPRLKSCSYLDFWALNKLINYIRDYFQPYFTSYLDQTLIRF